MTEMEAMMKIASQYQLAIVEDACQAILADIDGKKAGTWGQCGAFSLHPLKNLNVWGDAGIIVTNDEKTATSLRLLRNHGMANRDEIACFGYNSRLDSLHAVVGNWLISQTHSIAERRIEHAARYDAAFSSIPQIRIPPRAAGRKRVYHLYIVFAKKRDALLKHCLNHGIEAKIHYPIPLYQQRGLQHLGYRPGDFPVTDRHVDEIITFPCDQHLSNAEIDYVIDCVAEFYASEQASGLSHTKTTSAA